MNVSLKNFSVRSAVVSGALVWILYLVLQPFQAGGFYDLNVYLQAANVSRTGGNAYTDLPGLRFVYAPAVLSVFVAFGDWLEPVFFAVMAVSLLTLVHPKMRIFFWGSMAGAAIYVTYPPSALFAFKTGNISAPLHLILIFLFIVRGRLGLVPFALAVVLAASVKPFFLVYALLPVLMVGVNIITLSFLVLTTAIVVSLLLLQVLLLPEVFEDFLDSLRQQTVSNDGTGARADPGRSPFALLEKFLPIGRYEALALHTLVAGGWAGALIAAAHKLRHNLVPQAEGNAFLICVAVVAVNLLNPRLLVYDWFIIETASVGALLILARNEIDRVQFAVWPIVSAAMFTVLLAQIVLFAGDRSILGEWVLYSLFFYWLAFYPAALFLTARVGVLWWRYRRRSIVA